MVSPAARRIVVRPVSRLTRRRARGLSFACARPIGWWWCARPTTTGPTRLPFEIETAERRRVPPPARELVLLHHRRAGTRQPGRTSPILAGGLYRPAHRHIRLDYPCRHRSPVWLLNQTGHAAAASRHGGRRRKRAFTPRSVSPGRCAIGVPADQVGGNSALRTSPPASPRAGRTRSFRPALPRCLASIPAQPLNDC